MLENGSLEVRRARAEDLPSVTLIDAAIAGAARARGPYLRRAIAEGDCAVAVIEGDVAGYVVSNDAWFGHRFIWLLCVHPEYRRRGVATSLVQHTEKLCTSGKLFTSTNLSNQASQQLFQKLRFQVSGRIDNLDEGDPEIVFFKRVGSESLPITLVPMNDECAQVIAKWHYEDPYSFYDPENDPEDLAELLDATAREGVYYSALDERGELVGFFCFDIDDNDGTVEIGLGMRPDLTGKGNGLGFLLAGLRFAEATFSRHTYRLNVAAFNERAMRVYEKAGFRRTGNFMRRTNGGEFPFVEMTREELT